MSNAAFCVLTSLTVRPQWGQTKETQHILAPNHYRKSPSSKCIVRCTATSTLQNQAATTYAPVLLFPGLGNSAEDYVALAEKLKARGHEFVSVVPVRRWQWGLNVKGFFQRDYWRGTLKPKEVLKWYFDLVDDAIAKLDDTSAGAINFVGHSAGGWLAQAYIAERAKENLNVSTLLMLGTPARSPPEGNLDQTRGLLRYIEDNCDVEGKVSRVVCVAGRGTVGKPLGKGSIGEYLAYLSYAAVCGNGETDGDGVTPIDAACSINGELVFCEECTHSMWTRERWYGSDDAMSTWTSFLT